MFEVQVKVDLGEKTIAFLSGLAAVSNAQPAAATAEAAPAKEETRVAVKDGGTTKEMPYREFAEKADATKPAANAEPPARTRRTQAELKADAERTANGWDDMDDEAKLDAIKAEVTKHTKKGKSADIKFLLANFEAGRASELSPDDYDAFFDALTRYGKGESVEAIFPGLD